MNRIKLSCLALVALTMAGLALPAGAAPEDLAMLVVPARYSVLQVAFDVVNRFPAVLVSYQGDANTEDPIIHAWNGEEWVRISRDDYDQVNFLQVTPTLTVLVGDENLLPPVLSASPAIWCSRVETITSVDTTTLINDLARVLRFSASDWEWFARRYNLTLNDANAERRQRSWYDRKSYEDDYTRRWREKHHRGGRVAPEPDALIAPVEEPLVEQDMAPVIVEPEVAPVDVPGDWQEKAVSPDSDIK